jgi:hypothetical protein
MQGQGGALRSACDRCTASKTSCDGRSPCARCAKTGATCVFSAPKKRGPAPGFKRRRDEASIADSGEEGEASASARSSSGRGAVTVARAGSSSTAGGRAASAVPLADVMVQACMSLMWPHQRPLIPTAQEESYLASFFSKITGVMPIIDEGAFRAALRAAATWPLALSQRVPGDNTPMSRNEQHSPAVGTVLLYHTLLGLGSAIQNRKQESILYLQRAVVQVGPAALSPSEFSVLGVTFLALGAARLDSDPAVAAHRSLVLVGTAKAMCDGLDRLGKPVSIVVRLFLDFQHHIMREWRRAVSPVFLPPHTTPLLLQSGGLVSA